MIVIKPPYNGFGIPVRAEEDVRDALSMVVKMCFPHAMIEIYWKRPGAEFPDAILRLGVDQASGRAGLIYPADGDEFVPVGATNNELEFSDDHAADFRFPVLVTMDEAIEAVTSFFQTEGGKPSNLQWEEIWRRDENEV